MALNNWHIVRPNDMNSSNKSTWTKCKLIINILSKVKCTLQLRNIPWHFSAADENKTEDEIALVNLRQWMFANQIIEAGKLYMQRTKQMMHAEISLWLIANIYFVILKFQILHLFYSTMLQNNPKMKSPTHCFTPMKWRAEKCIFMNENAWIFIRISLKIVLTWPIDDKLALVQVMAWHQWPLSLRNLTYD